MHAPLCGIFCPREAFL
ncbi:MAG: hypothetical protein ACLRZ5_06145 [Ruminococcus sp.]